MDTSNLIVEILVIGSLAMWWVALLVLSGMGQPAVDLVSKAIQAEISLPLFIALYVAPAYCVGVIVNRVSDFVLRRIDTGLRHRYFKGAEANSMTSFRRAQITIFTSGEHVKSRLDWGRSLLRLARSSLVNFGLIAVLLPLAAWRLGIGHWGAVIIGSLLCAVFAGLGYLSWYRLCLIDYQITYVAGDMLSCKPAPDKGATGSQETTRGEPKG